MTINIERTSIGWLGTATVGGVVIARSSGRDWFDVWMRLSRLFGRLRMPHSLRVAV